MPDISQEQLLQSVREGLSDPDSPDFGRTLDALREVCSADRRGLFQALLEDPEPGLALGVARAVGILGSTEAVHLLAALVDEPGKWFCHADRDAIRVAAIESLGRLGDSRGTGVLLDLISSTRDAEMQMGAVRALGQIGAQSSVPPLIERMRADPRIALSAAGALAQIGGEEAFEGLMAGLKDDDEMIRSASVWALGKMGDSRAVDALMDLARSADLLLRRDIAWALGQIGGMPARLALGRLCQRDPDHAVRREAARAIRSGAVLGKCRSDPIADE